MDFKTLEEISESNNSLDDEQKEIQSKYIFERALDKFKNKQYKKTIIYIESSKFNSQTTYYWQILFLKLCSIQEIIERRLNKYYDSNEPIFASVFTISHNVAKVSFTFGNPDRLIEFY